MTAAPARPDDPAPGRRPALPLPRGPLSEALLRALARPPGTPLPDRTDGADPYGDDLHLALHCAYELHYRGFTGVDDAWEWDSGLLRLRAALERDFLTALRDDCGPARPAAEALGELLTEPAGDGDGVPGRLAEHGERWQLREYAAQRSLYHLKEADPHIWVVPRLWGRAKAGMVAVEYDEFGGGRADRIHSALFAALMADLGLETAYGHYTDACPAEMLALTTMMSAFGLHRALRGALVGHFAAVETTSSPASRLLVRALERIGAGPDAVRFYAEHVEADAVHEQVVRREVVGGLLAEEPALDAEVAFGADATAFLEDRLSRRLLAAWRENRTSLVTPLPPERPRPATAPPDPPPPAPGP
jgi:hypothetical protein